MAEVKTVQTAKPDIQITLSWEDAVAFGLYLGTTPTHNVAAQVYEGIDMVVCLEAIDGDSE